MFLFKSPPKKLVGFEDMKIAIKNPHRYIIINTLPIGEQSVLIRDTTPTDKEETVINTQLNDYNTPDLPIIVYGRNSCDLSAYQKQTQLHALGIVDVYVYAGGMFEWLLLQDAYGVDEFPTTNVGWVDILHYRPKSSLCTVYAG
jgi:hypothetical protein